VHHPDKPGKCEVRISEALQGKVHSILKKVGKKSQIGIAQIIQS
jgi:hypothetical protein